MRSKLLLPILVLSVITGLAAFMPGIAPAGEIPLTSHYKVLAPIGHGNLTVFPVVATTSHDTQESEPGSTLILPAGQSLHTLACDCVGANSDESVD